MRQKIGPDRRYQLPTPQSVRDALSYNPETGDLIWRWRPGKTLRCNQRHEGRVAGWVNKNGYVVVYLDGHDYFAHRLAHVIMTGEWPIAVTDHKDRVRNNNKWGNIRPATKGQNSLNRSPGVNASGIKGVRWHKYSWMARITLDGKTTNFCGLSSKEEAREVYNNAARYLHGEFAAPDTREL